METEITTAKSLCQYRKADFKSKLLQFTTVIRMYDYVLCKFRLRNFGTKGYGFCVLWLNWPASVVN